MRTLLVTNSFEPRNVGDLWVLRPRSMDLGVAVRFDHVVVCPDVSLDGEAFEVWMATEIEPRIKLPGEHRRRALIGASNLLSKIGSVLVGESVRSIDEQRRTDMLFRLGGRAREMAGITALAAMSDKAFRGGRPEPDDPDVLKLVRKVVKGEVLTGDDLDGLDDDDRQLLTNLEHLVAGLARLADELANIRGTKVAVEEAEDSLLVRALTRLREVDPDWVEGLQS